MKALKLLVAGVAVAGLAWSTSANAGAILDGIKKNGFIKCGANGVVPGFSTPDDKGNWSGIDADYCRAVAAALFGDKTKVKFQPMTAKERFTALQSGEIDILSRNTTWTQSRDTGLGVDFVGVVYYDGQGVMVRKSSGVKNAKGLNGATVCINQGTTTELNLADYFRANKMTYKAVTFEKMDAVVAAYAAGRCDAYTTDASGLAAQRVKLDKPKDHVILPDILSKEPLGPAVRHGDQEWADLARWTLYAMLNAEELGITSKNVDAMLKSENPEIKRLLGVGSDLGRTMGVKADWAYQIVKQVGNYGEIYDRNIGPNTPLGLDRGLNALWTKGGVQYAPPVR